MAESGPPTTAPGQPILPRKRASAAKPAGWRPPTNWTRKKWLVTAGVVGGLILLLVLGTFAYAFATLPDPSKLDLAGGTITIKDRHGMLIEQRNSQGVRVTPVHLNEISKNLQDATISVEDKHFYEHHGVDWGRVIKAGIIDVIARRPAQGASTITEQLAKVAILQSPKKTILRKLREAMVATALESKYKKDQILELYLNSIYYGHHATGIEAASEVYFGVHAKDLTLGQASLLAGLPQGPSVYDALLHKDRALERQARAIEGARYGPYQHETFEHYLAHREGDEGSGTSPYLQTAFLALDPRNGAVRVMIGGRDFDDSKFNRSVQALRQPGSAFKPIVYAAAIQNGRPASYIVNDSPLVLQVPGQPEWAPQNYDLKFLGEIPLRESLYDSRNLSTIRLGMELGEQTVINEARNFGITTPVPPYPSIHIGAADVYPIELISAYTAFANLGVRATPNAIIRVENQKGEILWQPTPTRSQVLSPEEAWLMVDMMKDVVRRGTAAGSVWGAGFHYPAGGKTGTTNDGTNVWFIGYTADLVAGAWMGFDRPQKIKDNAQGGVLAAPAWTAFMTEVYRRKPPPPDWPRPISIVTREIDVSSGLLQTPYCPRNLVTTEFYISGTEPTRDCDKHGPYSPGAGIDTLSTVPVTPYNTGAPPTIRVTPPPIQPGYGPVPSGKQRTPTVFDTTRRDPTRRDTTRGTPIRRDTIPSVPPPGKTPR